MYSVNVMLSKLLFLVKFEMKFLKLKLKDKTLAIYEQNSRLCIARKSNSCLCRQNKLELEKLEHY